MLSAQSPCPSTRPRCARARPSAMILYGAMAAWSERQESEEAAAAERAHSKRPQRRRSPPAWVMKFRSWSPNGRRSQRTALSSASVGPSPRPGVHQLYWLGQRQRRRGQRWTRWRGSFANGTKDVAKLRSDGASFCSEQSLVVTLGPLLTGGPPEEGVKSAHAHSLSRYLRKAGYPPAVRTSLLFAPVTR